MKKTRQLYNDNLCLSRALVLHSHGTQRLEDKTSELFNLFINKIDGVSPSTFQRVHLNCFRTVDVLLTLQFLLYDIHIVAGNIVRELATRS